MFKHLCQPLFSHSLTAGVVYFDQLAGALHAIHWSESSFFNVLTSFSVIMEKKEENSKILKKKNLKKWVYQSFAG